MNKQELAQRIVRDMGYDYQTVRNIIDGIAYEGWLRNPDQMPGRTMTDSELRRLIDKHLPDGTTFEQVSMFMIDLGHDIVPDPEPTNAEKLAPLLHHSGWGDLSLNQAEGLAAELDRAGVKAPEAGGDDEQ